MQIEQIPRRDLSGHDRMPNSGFSEQLQQTPELAYPEPLDRVHHRGKTRIGFVNESGGNNLLYSGATGSARKFGRVNAITRDNAERFGSLHSGNVAEESS